MPFLFSGGFLALTIIFLFFLARRSYYTVCAVENSLRPRAQYAPQCLYVNLAADDGLTESATDTSSYHRRRGSAARRRGRPGAVFEGSRVARYTYVLYNPVLAISIEGTNYTRLDLNIDKVFKASPPPISAPVCPFFLSSYRRTTCASYSCFHPRPPRRRRTDADVRTRTHGGDGHGRAKKRTELVSRLLCLASVGATTAACRMQGEPGPLSAKGGSSYAFLTKKTSASDLSRVSGWNARGRAAAHWDYNELI